MATKKDGFGGIDGDLPPLIKPGKYDAAFVHYQTAVMFGRAPKLVLVFKIVSFGEYFDTKVPRYYNVRRVIGKPAMNGCFKVGAKSDFLRDYAQLFTLPRRLDRIPMSAWEKHVFEVTIRTVEHGSNQREIPEGLRYSVIDAIRSIKQ